MNRKLITRMLGALLLIEAAAMLPSLLIALICSEGDSLALGLGMIINLLVGSVMFLLPDNDKNSHHNYRRQCFYTAGF